MTRPADDAPAGSPLHRGRHVLVLGGARSGKSSFAQCLAEASERRLVYCATAADYGDREMADRIARHRAARDDRWRTVEVQFDLLATLRRESTPDTVILVDCLTLWLTAVMLGERDDEAASAELAEAVAGFPGPVVFVSNEVGAGIVPDNRLARRFRDAQGRLNQRMAAACDTVVLVTAGLPLVLKPSPGPAVTLAGL